MTAMLKIVVLLAGAVLLTSGVCEATSIVGFWTKTEVIIAADGLRGEKDELGNVIGQETACKIYTGPRGIYFAVGGVAPTFRGHRFAVDQIISAAKFNGASAAEQVRDAIHELHSKVTLLWHDIRESDLAFYTSTIAGHAIQVIFGWSQTGELGMASYSAIPLPDGRSSAPDLKIYPKESDLSGALRWLTGGSNDKAMKQRLDAVNKGTEPLPDALPEFARQLIQLETDADVAKHPDGKGRSVGPPIDVLVITAQGAQSYKRQPESKCPALARLNISLVICYRV